MVMRKTSPTGAARKTSNSILRLTEISRSPGIPHLFRHIRQRDNLLRTEVQTMGVGLGNRYQVEWVNRADYGPGG